MPSLTAKDRVSLCQFSFTDGRRCRTPRTGTHPHFCFYHAQKETQAQSTDKLAKDLANFFSGDYLSACDLSAAMARLIPAVIRGDIKPRLARTVAYMFQTQLQAIHLSQNEYINAFGTDTWRKALRSSVNVNYDCRFPSNPTHAEACHPERSEVPCPNPASSTIDKTRLPSAPARNGSPQNPNQAYQQHPAGRPTSPPTNHAKPRPLPRPPQPQPPTPGVFQTPLESGLAEHLVFIE
jgi:hypothetical protein